MRNHKVNYATWPALLRVGQQEHVMPCDQALGSGEERALKAYTKGVGWLHASHTDLQNRQTHSSEALGGAFGERSMVLTCDRIGARCCRLTATFAGLASASLRPPPGFPGSDAAPPCRHQGATLLGLGFLDFCLCPLRVHRQNERRAPSRRERGNPGPLPLPEPEP